MDILLLSNIILVISAFIVLLLATITDLKKLEVPDWLNFSFLAFAAFVKIAATIISGDLSILSNAAISFTIIFIFGIILYYAQSLGGGDIKLLFGLGIAFSSMPYFFEQQISQINLGNGPFIFSFILNALFLGAVYGLFFSIYIIIKNKRNFLKFKRNFMGHLNEKDLFFKILLWSCIIVGILILFMATFTPVLTFLALIIFIAPLIFLLVKTVEEEFLVKSINSEDLAEGDWILNKIKTKDRTIEPTVHGLTNSQIAYLRKRYKKKIRVKFGLPFVPCFLISLLLTIFFGNMLLKIVTLFI